MYCRRYSSTGRTALALAGLQASAACRPSCGSPGSPSRPSDLYVAMKDVVEFAAAGRVQKQSTAIGYLKAQHHTLDWVEAARVRQEGGA